MIQKWFRPIICTAASFLSGILLVFAFPNHNAYWLAWVAVVPLLLAIYGKVPIRAFFLSFLTGVTFFVGICGWILESPGYRVLHHVLAGSFLGAPFGLFGFAFAYTFRRHGGGMAFFTAPFAWVCMEYLRSNLSFLALPLGLIAHSQYLNPLLIQSSAFAGVYGVGFILAMVNSAIAGMALSLFQKPKDPQNVKRAPISWRGAAFVACTAAALFLVSLFHGMWSLSQPEVGKGIKVALVQGNIDQDKKWNPKYAQTIMETYADLTREASAGEPALIIWPEAATPRAMNVDRRIYLAVRQIVEDTNTSLLLGSTMHQKFKERGGKEVRYKNSAFLVVPGRPDKTQEYSKIILVPFGEYVPMEGFVPWSWINVPDVANYLPGNEWTVFEGPGSSFGVTICWESIFPELARKFVNNGAQFIVNITNESWYKDTAGPYQFLAASVFRAVENGVYVLRCANTGISCFIDTRGRIVDRVRDKGGRDTYVQGVLTGTVVTGNSKTFYTRYGDWVVWVSFGWLGILLVFGLVVRRGEEAPQPRSLL